LNNTQLTMRCAIKIPLLRSSRLICREGPREGALLRHPALRRLRPQAVSLYREKKAGVPAAEQSRPQAQ
jgi:hypothetical protein